jgi:hypothetical protein
VIHGQVNSSVSGSIEDASPIRIEQVAHYLELMCSHLISKIDLSSVFSDEVADETIRAEVTLTWRKVSITALQLCRYQNCQYCGGAANVAGDRYEFPSAQKECLPLDIAFYRTRLADFLPSANCLGASSLALNCSGIISFTRNVNFY